MPTFGQHSQEQYKTLHPKLQKIMDLAIQTFDFRIEEGFRNEEKQHADFLAGNSKLDWPHGNHNQYPSRAVDCYPSPVDYSSSPKNLERFMYMQGIFRQCAFQLGIKIRQGIDWNGNMDMRDEGSFRDYPHLELASTEV